MTEHPSKLRAGGHTPGPYEIVLSEMSGEFLIYGSDDTVGHLAEVHGHNAEANALLFAQAPTLLRQGDELVGAFNNILQLLGNVKHGTETGARDALCRGDMLDSIRDLVQEVLAECKQPGTTPE